MSIRATSSLVAGLMIAIGTGAAAGERDSAAIADACATCHGPDGRSSGAIPSIANMPAAELTAAMRAFRDGERAPTLMDEIAKGLSDAEIEALAGYLAEKEARP